MSYYVYHFRGRPIFAVPAESRRIRRSAWRFCPMETPLRRFTRWGMRLGQTLGLDRWLGRRMENPPLWENFDFSRWLEKVRGELGRGDLEAVIVWHRVYRARSYVHLVDREGRYAAFAKLGFCEADHERFRKEGGRMAAVNQWGVRGIRIPQIIGQGAAGACRYLLFEPMPTHPVTLAPASLSFLDRVIAGYTDSAQWIGRGELTALPWWEKFVGMTDANGSFRLEMERLMPDKAEFRRSHGDMRRGNIRLVKGEIWLFDWENSRDSAPAMVDQVSFYLSQQPKGQPPSQSLKRLWRDFSLDDPDQRFKIMLILAYGCGTGSHAAMKLVEAWPEQAVPLAAAGNSA